MALFVANLAWWEKIETQRSRVESANHTPESRRGWRETEASQRGVGGLAASEDQGGSDVGPLRRDHGHGGAQSRPSEFLGSPRPLKQNAWFVSRRSPLFSGDSDHLFHPAPVHETQFLEDIPNEAEPVVDFERWGASALVLTDHSWRDDGLL